MDKLKEIKYFNKQYPTEKNIVLLKLPLQSTRPLRYQFDIKL